MRGILCSVCGGRTGVRKTRNKDGAVLRRRVCVGLPQTAEAPAVPGCGFSCWTSERRLGTNEAISVPMVSGVHILAQNLSLVP
jgi:hypothetical protein